MKKLYRSRSDKKVGGVCGGLAKHLDISTKLIRLIFVLVSFVAMVGLWIYLALWIAYPLEPEEGDLSLKFKPEIKKIETSKEGYELESKKMATINKSDSKAIENDKHTKDRKAILITVGLFASMVFFCLSQFGLFDKNKEPAESPITPIPIQIPGWEDVIINTLCLDISQEYPEEWFGFFKETLVKLGMDITPRQYSFPYDSVIGEIMQEIGIQVVEQGTQCDARLAINVKGDYKTATYGRISKDRCYTGSYVGISISLSHKEKETFKDNFSGQVNPPEFITSGGCPDQAYKAPYMDTSAEAITKALVSIWGTDIATLIKREYSIGDDSEKAMAGAAKEILRNSINTAPTMPPPEPPSQPTQ